MISRRCVYVPCKQSGLNARTAPIIIFYYGENKKRKYCMSIGAQMLHKSIIVKYKINKRIVTIR